MTPSQTGWMLFIAAVGMMSSLTAVDIALLGGWEDVYTPKFLARILINLSGVITAFIGGKLIPEKRNGKRTRSSDIGEDDG